MKKSIFPADTYIVINKTILNDYDRKILLTLYQPIIGYQSISLYSTLCSYLDKNEMISLEWTHHHLMNNMGISLQEITEAREKLEAIGLLKTYRKQDHITTYIYELYSPISAYEFLNNPVLATALYTTIGKLEYEKTVNYFKLPRINLTGYEEITRTFNEIFESTHNPNILPVEKMKGRKSNQFSITPKFDLNTILELIPDELLNKRSITKDTKELIYKLSFIYNFSEDMMQEIIRNSISEKHTIDKSLLKMNSRKYYQFENYGKLPGLIYRNQPEYLRKPTGDTSNRAKIIYTFETTSPYDFLNSKYKDTQPSKSDLAILELLLIDFNLKPGVTNVLLDYVLKTNNNKLTKSYIETIASQWKKSNIETVEDAMKIASKEYQRSKNYKTKTTQVKKQEQKPDWFDKNFETNEATEEEKQKMAELLKEFN